MIEHSLFRLLRCPVTRSRLHALDENLLESDVGQHRYPVVHGIPDFRQFDPPYMSRAQERDAVERIVSASARMTYDRLLAHFEEDIWPERRPAETVRKQVQHRLALRRRSAHRLETLFDEAGVSRIEGGVALDLGCGSGEAIGALIQRGATQVVGVDISLVELVLARKLLDEEGRTALLAAGCAEALPLADSTLDFVYSPDVIEHVADQRLYLAEARRVLAPRRRLLLNSPNRFAVVCPEPHVGIWFFGFLPRSLMDPICRMIGKGPYVGKRLVSLHELRRLLSSTFDRYEIHSRKANPNAASVAGKVYRALRPFSEQAYALVCDQHVVLVTV